MQPPSDAIEIAENTEKSDGEAIPSGADDIGGALSAVALRLANDSFWDLPAISPLQIAETKQ